jgi:hypothetical protein
MALNLVWGMVALSLLGAVYSGTRRGVLSVSAASAMTVAVLICFILLPAISASDDMLDQQQAGLPLSGQTWRLVSEDISTGVELPPVTLYLMLLICSLAATQTVVQVRRPIRLLAGRIAVSQRLRPPPFAAQ